MIRKIFIGGNWKSNNLLASSEKLVADVYNKIQFDTNKIGKQVLTADVVAFPAECQLSSVRQWMKKEIGVGNQNVSQNNFGAFTGETT